MAPCNWEGNISNYTFLLMIVCCAVFVGNLPRHESSNSLRLEILGKPIAEREKHGPNEKRNHYIATWFCFHLIPKEKAERN